ncbi:hypothetical protein [Nostoc sp. MS1]|uniref:hypothetical protein n=1 Tax=Nostoc sp. MS1 TaxID=2764711 RepID=UPI001CC3FF39|nr:hypothetical protein [Nostoc sp. MS1]BCL40047.1 hypothetical protein NSMS1_64940 [Nostoc sp. MS1]
MDLPKEYPFIHVYAQPEAHKPVIIKGNTEGLCVLINALVTAIAQGNCNGVAEVFDGDAEVYELRVQMVNSHDELAPVPYKDYSNELK